LGAVIYALKKALQTLHELIMFPVHQGNCS